MTAPTWAAHEMTHDTGSGALPATSVPAYLRDASGESYDDGSSGAIFETTPTTKLARWMCRRGNRGWGLPLALVAAAGYAALATFFYGMHHVAVWALVALFAWNAAKFALVAVWLTLAGVVDLGRGAVRRLRDGQSRGVSPSW